MSRFPTTLNEHEYLEIEEAIASTVRGRAYLRMRDHRASLIAGDQGRRMLADLREWLEERDVRNGRQGDLGAMQRELKELRAHIERSRNEIAQLGTKDGKGVAGARFSGATEELYEIVASTERATSDILGAAEWIQEQVGELGLDPARRRGFDDRCMEIFTACSFQDITGQRVAKVVAAMAYVEQRVGAMVSMWDEESEPPGGVRTGQGGERSAQPGDAADAPESGEAQLLNGPQLPGHGLGQDAVDVLFGTPTKGSQPASPPAPPAPTQKMPPVKAAPAAAKPLAPKATASKTAEPKASKATTPAKPIEMPTAAVAATAKLDQSAVDALFD